MSRFNLLDGDPPTVDLTRIRRGCILVRKYRRPAKTVSGLYVAPGAWRKDNSGSLWEYIAHASTIEDDRGSVRPWDEVFPFKFESLSYVIQTPNFSGVDLGDGEHFLITADNVQGVWPYQPEED